MLKREKGNTRKYIFIVVFRFLGAGCDSITQKQYWNAIQVIGRTKVQLQQLNVVPTITVEFICAYIGKTHIKESFFSGRTIEVRVQSAFSGVVLAKLDIVYA